MKALPTMPQLIAAAMLGGVLPFDRPAPRYAPPADPGSFQSNGGRSRAYTRDDARARANRIAKRRAKKGYK